MKLEKISATQIGLARKCEMWLYYKMTKPSPEKQPVYLFIGSVFHAVIEAYFKALAEGRKLAKSEIRGILGAEFDKRISDTDFTKMTQQKAKERCQVLVETYLANFGGLLHPLNAESIELPIQFKIKSGGQELLITGKVDMIAKGGVIIDHKTGRLLNPIDEVQPYIYFAGLRANGYDVRSFRFNVVDNGSVQVFEVPFQEAKAQELFNYAFSLQRAWEEGNLFFATKEKVCQFCEFKNVCEKNS